MNAIIYTRVSSDEQVEGTSLDFQREDCLRYAQNKGMAVVAMFEERGESAKFADRPQLQELMRQCAARKRKIDALIVWKLDRLSRNQMDYYYIKRTLSEQGIAIHSATEASLDGPDSLSSRVYETFTALQAEIDNCIRRERVIRGMAAKVEAGIYPWQPPLGYLCGRSRARGLKKLAPDEPDPERFALVQRLFRTCLDEGICSTAELARLGNAWGLRTLNGKRLYNQQVDRILCNKYYAGIIANPWTGEEFAAKHKAMLTAAEFEEVQHLRSGKPRPKKRRAAEHPDFPLRRTVRCASCRGPLTGSWSRGNGGRYAYYHCAKTRCPAYGKGVPKKRLEAEFTDLVLKHTPTGPMLNVFVEAVQHVWDYRHSAAIQASRSSAKRLSELESRLDTLIDMRAQSLLTDEEFLPRKQAIGESISEIRQSAKRAEAVQYDLPTVAKKTAKRIENYPRNWHTLPVAQRRWFEKVIFPEGIPHSRETGFGTAKTGLCYELIWTSRGSKSRMVHLVYKSWNQLIEYFGNIT